MTINALALPTDIPWRRRCVSPDMLDPVICDTQFPLKWRSSIAVFTYEPPEPEQTLPDSIVSYVKVSCTITGHQRNPQSDLSLPKTLKGFESADVTEAFKTLVGKYHACYGALLQVSVGSNRAPNPIQPFEQLPDPPYIADFEPKKRELYELVTETGETLSRTLEGINVRKSNVNSQSSEVVDGTAISLKLSQTSGTKEAQQPETTQSGQFEVSNTKTNVASGQVEDTRTSDASREARESFSYTTQLTQMYHQLTGYHLGTNRALFFMLPRPHIVQSAETFVKGPRHLEGVQEVFLVVVRPKGWDDVCIEAYLETAHLSEPEMAFGELNVIWTTKKVQAGIETVSDSDDEFSKDDRDGPEISDVDVYKPPPGYTIKAATKRIEDTQQLTQQGKVEELQNDADAVVVWLSAHAHFTDVQKPFKSDYRTPGWAQAIYDIVLKTTEQRPIDGPRRIFLTGRRVCCCDKGLASYLRDFISYERALDIPPRHYGALGRPQLKPEERFTGIDPGLSIREANQLRDLIGAEMMASVNSASRLPAGLLGFEESELLAQVVARRLKRRDDRPAHELEGLTSRLRSRLLERSGEGLRRSDLLAMSPQEQQARFGLDKEDLVALRRAAIGLVAGDDDPASEWDRRRYGDSAVPDVMHQSLDEATARVRRAGLSVGAVTYVDSPASRGTVLRQKPPPGPRRMGTDLVTLQVASGACVLVPELTELSVADAVLALRDAGVQSAPKFAPARARAAGRVRSSHPRAGTWITPNAEVVLTLADPD